MKKKYILFTIVLILIIPSCKEKKEPRILETLVKKAENIYVVKIENELLASPLGFTKEKGNKMDIVGTFFIKKKLKYTKLPKKMDAPFTKVDEKYDKDNPFGTSEEEWKKEMAKRKKRLAEEKKGI